MAHIDKVHSASTKLTPHQGIWLNNGYKPNSWGYEKSKMATWLFPDPWQIPLLFDKIKLFLASGLISHNGVLGGGIVKMYFLQSPVTGATTLPDRSYRHWQKTSTASWRLSLSPTSLVIRHGRQNKGIGRMGLNRLLNMITILLTFCLTYYRLLIFVCRYKEALLLKLLTV